MADRVETERVLKAYAAAWMAGDLEAVLAAYHDDIQLHYMGQSTLAGTHAGRDAAFAALGQASLRTARRLIGVEDVLVGESLGALLAVEDNKLRECLLYDEDQRFIDGLWSQEP